MIDIVIVNWNAGQQLRRCIESILKYSAENVSEIVVVDNGSTDESCLSISDFNRLTIIKNKSNLGFAKACNIGARDLKSDYLLFLNPDAGVYQDTIANVLTFMNDDSNADFGICGVQLKDSNNDIARSCTRFPTLKSMLIDSVGLDRLFPSQGYFMREWSHDSTREVDHVIGAFYFVRRELFEKLKGFDERFFVYLEDLDFSYRANQIGVKTIYLSEAKALHIGGGTSQQVKAKRLFYSIRSRLLYAFKHFPAWQAWLVMITSYSLELISRLSFSLIRLDIGGGKNTIEAYKMLYAETGSIISSRNFQP